MMPIEQLPTNIIVIGCIPTRSFPVAFVCRLEPSGRIVEVIDHERSMPLEDDDYPTYFELLPDTVDAFLGDGL